MQVLEADVSIDSTFNNATYGNGLRNACHLPSYLGPVLCIPILPRGFKRFDIIRPALTTPRTAWMRSFLTQCSEQHAVGSEALRGSVLSSNNTAIGRAALKGPDSSSSTSEGYNVAVGSHALYSNTTGAYNIANGAWALYANTEGGGNTANGNEALRQNIDGSGNTATGYLALSSTINSSRNTATGASALLDNTGEGNTGVGHGVLIGNTSGENNTAVGRGALQTNLTGSKNTAIGFAADVANGDLTNATAIGSLALVDADNKIQLGNSDVDSVATTGKLTTGAVTYPNQDGEAGQVLTTDGLGNIGWAGNTVSAVDNLGLIQRIASLEEQLKTQQQNLLAIVQSQQEQIAQLQRTVEHQFVAK